jgi:hypothetical protein
MSMALLQQLNGGARGRFYRYLERLGDRCPRIAWYPSSGEDLRDLLFLSAPYQQLSPSQAGGPEPAPPDLFVHTDYFPWVHSTFMDTSKLFGDGRSSIWLNDVEELPRLHLPLDRRLVDFPDGSYATNHAVFGLASVVSDRLGEFKVPLLYLFCENTAFFASMALPLRARFSHVVRVRYGSGCGGGRSAGAWIRYALGAIGAEALIPDTEFHDLETDCALEAYPEIRDVLAEPVLTEVRKVPGTAWAYPHDIGWYSVGCEAPGAG